MTSKILAVLEWGFTFKVAISIQIVVLPGNNKMHNNASVTHVQTACLSFCKIFPRVGFSFHKSNDWEFYYYYSLHRVFIDNIRQHEYSTTALLSSVTTQPLAMWSNGMDTHTHTDMYVGIYTVLINMWIMKMPFNCRGMIRHGKADTHSFLLIILLSSPPGCVFSETAFP